MRAITQLPILALMLCLTACATTPGAPVPGAGSPAEDSVFSAEDAARSFSEVVAAVQPVAERECNRLAPALNCNYRIVVDGRRSAQPNAFQSIDASGRPVITFTVSLIASVSNADELAFILSHEAAHHILNHLARQRRNAEAGAVVFAGLATLTGGSSADVATAQKLGAAVGARSYSKEFELEADELGTVITFRAGYDPLAGAGFFSSIPDPGDRFLGTHPPNADRLDKVLRTGMRMGFCRDSYALSQMRCRAPAG